MWVFSTLLLGRPKAETTHATEKILAWTEAVHWLRNVCYSKSPPSRRPGPLISTCVFKPLGYQIYGCSSHWRSRVNIAQGTKGWRFDLTYHDMPSTSLPQVRLSGTIFYIMLAPYSNNFAHCNTGITDETVSCYIRRGYICKLGRD